VLDATGVDGLLIGRAAQGRPWIFREIEHYLRTGEHLPAPQLDEVERILLEHLAALHAFYGDVMGVRIARKHVGWYLATDPAARSFAPGSTLWTHKRSAPTFARFSRTSTEP
jgi:tRNA-dihydrouridine synthase B